MLYSIDCSSAGLESSQLVVGIDCTKSNTWTGARSFGGRCMHEIVPGQLNPYQAVISIVGRTLAPFDDDVSLLRWRIIAFNVPT